MEHYTSSEFPRNEPSGLRPSANLQRYKSLGSGTGRDEPSGFTQRHLLTDPDQRELFPNRLNACLVPQARGQSTAPQERSGSFRLDVAPCTFPHHQHLFLEPPERAEL